MMESIQNRWDVIALGYAKFMNLLGDKKQIDGLSGYNLVGDRVWGHFSIEVNDDELTLNYDDSRNPKWLRKVRDKIKPGGDGWIGTLYYSGKAIFKFQLRRPHAN